MRKLSTALVVCCWSWVALADLTPGQQFAAAQQSLRQGNPADALTGFESLQQAYPDNVDYVFGYGIALSQLGRDDEALVQLHRAIRLAPDYEDVWRTCYQVLARQQSADELLELRLEAAQRFPDATWWQPSARGDAYAWTLTVGAGFDFLDNAYPNWDNQFTELWLEGDRGRRYAVRLSRDARDHDSDLTTGFSAEAGLGAWRAGATLQLSGSPEFMPETGVELFTGRSFDDGWAATVRYRYRRYSNAIVSTAILGAEKYFGNWRIAYDFGWSALHGSSRFANHVLHGNWYYSDRSSVGLSFATGHEAEAVGGGRVIETAVSGLSFNGRHRFSQRLDMHWWLGMHEQGDYYRRLFLGMAFSIRF